jgi:hypothetical protein
MAVINVPSKSSGDTFFSEECNQIVEAIKLLQQNTGYGLYSDDSKTELAPQVISSGGFEAVINNAALKDESHLPIVGGVPFSLYDGNKVLGSQDGAKISFYIRFRASINSNDSSFQIAFDVGNVEPDLISVETVPRGQNVYHDYLVSASTRVSDSFFANGAILKFQCDDVLSVYGVTFFTSVDYVPII